MTGPNHREYIIGPLLVRLTNGAGQCLRLTASEWQDGLLLGCLAGWLPTGTTAPSYWCASESWDGRYAEPHGQTMTAEDCARLGAALHAVLDRIHRGTQTLNDPCELSQRLPRWTAPLKSARAAFGFFQIGPVVVELEEGCWLDWFSDADEDGEPEPPF